MKLENRNYEPTKGVARGTADAIVYGNILRERGHDEYRTSKKIYLKLIVDTNDFYDGELHIDDHDVYVPKAWAEDDFAELNGVKAVTDEIREKCEQKKNGVQLVIYEVTFQVKSKNHSINRGAPFSVGRFR